MKRTPLLIVLLLTCCGGSGSEALPESPSQTSATSHTPIFDFCADSEEIGGLRMAIRKGTETDEELINQTDRLQDLLRAASARESDADGRKALGELTEALGQLKVALDQAGSSYQFDAAVRLRVKAVSYRGLTAALILECPS